MAQQNPVVTETNRQPHTEREKAPGRVCEMCEPDSDHDVRVYWSTEHGQEICLCKTCGQRDKFE